MQPVKSRRSRDLFLQLLSEKYFVVQYDSVVEKLRFQLTMGFNDPDLSLISLMEKTGYNKDYIRRKFVTSFGMTPVEYLTSIRIENAKKLLATRYITKTPIGEIGAMCGYYDRLYFSRIFKKT